MTTIAYKDGLLASDSLATANATVVGTTQKIARAQDGGLIGAAGSAAYVHKLIQWAEAGHGTNPPLPEDDSIGLWVHPNGAVFKLEPKGLFPSHAPYFALGSGWTHAVAIMEFGGTAEEAVRVSIALDTCSGGEIKTLRLEGLAGKAGDA